MFLEVAALWAYRRENTTAQQPAVEKEVGPRQPFDAPAAAPAGTV